MQENYIVCSIDIFAMMQTIMVCDKNSNIKISQSCVLGDIPELVVNTANKYSISEIIITGNLNYAGLLSTQIKGMNPNLKIVLK